MAGINLAALVAASRPAGGFSCYTERDGGDWYCIAGENESWHGSERVAEGFHVRDNARALLAWGLAGGAMPANWKTREVRRQSVALAMPGESDWLTIWREAWERVFPLAPLPAVPVE